MKAPLLSWPTWLRYMLAALALALACPGCGDLTPQEKAQASVSAGAEVVAAFDEHAAERLTEATEAALADASSMEEWRDAARPWKRLTIALRATKSALLTAQAALNVWKATGDDAAFRAVAGCLVAQIELLYAAARGVDLNDRLRALGPLVGIAGAYTDGLCPEADR